MFHGTKNNLLPSRIEDMILVLLSLFFIQERCPLYVLNTHNLSIMYYLRQKQRRALSRSALLTNACTHCDIEERHAITLVSHM